MGGAAVTSGLLAWGWLAAVALREIQPPHPATPKEYGMSSSDDIARLRAEMDLAREGVKEYAGNLWAFYSELVEQGFSSDQALALAVTFLTESLRGASGNNE